MSEECSNPTCFVHVGESCSEGESDVNCCKHWTKQTNKEISEPAEIIKKPVRVPWSGSALGSSDLMNITPRGRSILIGVLGAQNTGKTTLLTGNYLQLLRGKMVADATFAGSQTLGAWESLASWARFDSTSPLASFPPHTPRGTERIPGLLHFALRKNNDEFRDILLTDAPGEWFTRWSIEQNASDAVGAKWVVENADAFLIFADCEKLSGSKRGQARSELRQLIERLGNHVKNRPTTLVWAKNDQVPREGIVNAIRKALNENIPHAVEVDTTIEKPESLTAALETVVSATWSPPLSIPIFEPVIQTNPFAAFRGRYANT